MPPGTPRCALAVLLSVACATVTAGCRHSPTPGAAPPRPNVLLVTVDTLRADRLGTGLMPALDRLAARGLRFTNARTNVPLTLPSHATILTGLLPPHHGVRLNGVGRLAGHATLATILRQNGYRTSAVVGAFVLARQFGLDAGFDRYDDAVPRDAHVSTALEAERGAAAVTDAALAALAAGSATPPAGAAPGAPSPPFFLWVHYYDPHAPYRPPPQFLAQARGNAYDGEAAYVDREVERLLGSLPRFDHGRETRVIVAGDHGESLGEHGEATHGMLLYEAALRVPLIFATLPPGAAAADRVQGRDGAAMRSESVSLADVAPTVLAMLAIAPPAPMDGVSLLAAGVPDRELYSETTYPSLAGWSPLAALVSGPWKLVRGGRVQLFDLRRDPGEIRNQSGERAAIATRMDDRLRAMAAGGKDVKATLSAEARDRLRALGYVAPSSLPPTVLGGAPDPTDRIGDWRAFEAAAAAGAIDHLRDVARRNPEAQVFQTTLAQALARAGRHAEALSSYREAARRWPGDAVLLHDLAVAARDGGEPLEAARAEEAALALDPKYAAASNGLGLLHADAGRPREAAVAFERAAALDPSDPSYAANLGNARRALGQADVARQAYLAALAVDPAWPDAANGVGVLEVQVGRAADAIPWFEKALARDPGFVEARLNLGIACQEAGQAARARREYMAVLRAPARHRRERDAARQLLQGLRR